jgi:F-type H+-transporting ATPase subunit delta
LREEILIVAMVVANRYARALAEVVDPAGDYRQVLRELRDFAGVYRQSADLREVLLTPAVSLDAKRRLLVAILERLGSSQVTTNFLRVLLDNYRIALLDEVIEAYRRTAYDRLGIAEIRIASAADLTPAAREALRTGFAKLIPQRGMEIEFHLEPALLGGIIAQIRSTVYDGSVRGQLDRLRQELMGR